MATQVKLRTKPISKARLSLYLDFYPPIPHPDTGKLTRREFLNIHILEKPKTYLEKEENKKLKDLAESIRAKRHLEVKNENFGFLSKNKAPKETDFIKYFDDIITRKKETTTPSTVSNWNSTKKHLEEFSSYAVLFSEITPTFCEDFKQHLLNKLSQNSAHSYFLKFREAINKAIDDEYLSKNPLKKVKVIPAAESNREFLSIEELRRLADTECELEWLKRAALFTSLTGLRYVDLQKMTWSEVEHSEDLGYYLRFTQRKTKGAETLPISDQARSYLGEAGMPQERVFEGIPEKMGSWENLRLKQWVLNAEIKKTVTFHVFRHTFATLQLTNGTDIYTVNKMLGHKSLKTTQIYAKVIDQKKKEAANKITI
jgi:integrase